MYVTLPTLSDQKHLHSHETLPFYFPVERQSHHRTKTIFKLDENL